MKNTVYILLILCVLGCGTWIFCNSRNAKTAEIRLQTQKKQAEATIAHAKAMEAKEQREAAELNKKAKTKDAEAKAAARDEAKHKAEEAKADERAAADNRKTAEAEAKKAESNRKKAEADAAAAKDRRIAAEAELKTAEATNETLQVELEIAREARIKANLDLEVKSKALAAEELKKADYDTALANVRELQAILRQREEDSRPDRTLKDLLEDNEVEPVVEELSPEELAEQAAAESNRVAKIARRIEPKTRGDEKIEAAEARMNRISEEGRKVLRAKARARLEALARRAAKDGRTAVAEYYLRQAAELFGEEKKEEEPADDGK